MKTADKKLTLSKTTLKHLHTRVRSSIQAGNGIGPDTIDIRLSCRGGVHQAPGPLVVSVTAGAAQPRARGSRGPEPDSSPLAGGRFAAHTSSGTLGSRRAPLGLPRGSPGERIQG